MTNRRDTETERIRIADMKPVYFHTEYNDRGEVIDGWVSCGSRYKEQALGRLLEAISERYHDIIKAIAARTGQG